MITTLAAVAVAYLVTVGRWADGWFGATLGFAVVGTGPLLLRATALRFPRFKHLEVVADLWLLPSAIIGHACLARVVDVARPVVLDGYLARADLALFGVHPGAVLEQWSPPWLIELLLACYYTFYLWPVVLGVVLHFTTTRKVLEEYGLALCLLFGVNFVSYVLVPAVGPRFFLADQFQGPLQGLWLTPLLDSAMRGPAFMKDCFPSGHTAVTLVVLVYAFWHARRLFWAILPVGSGIIAATVVCRFHYVTDLIAAVPMMLACVSAAGLTARVREALERAPAARWATAIVAAFRPR